MSLMLWVVAMVVVADSAAQMAGIPPKCCFDKEFTVVMGEIGAIADLSNNTERLIDGYIRLGYDFYRHREGLYNHLRQFDGSYQITTQIRDFTSGLQYTKTGNGTCVTQHLPPWERLLSPCIPDSATYMGPATFGFGTNVIYVNKWTFEAPGNRTMTLYVTRDYCIPVVQNIDGTFNGAPLELSLVYTNYRPGIEDLNTLSIPDDCPTDAGPILGRR